MWNTSHKRTRFQTDDIRTWRNTRYITLAQLRILLSFCVMFDFHSSFVDFTFFEWMTALCHSCTCNTMSTPFALLFRISYFAQQLSQKNAQVYDQNNDNTSTFLLPCISISDLYGKLIISGAARCRTSCFHSALMCAGPPAEFSSTRWVFYLLFAMHRMVQL